MRTGLTILAGLLAGALVAIGLLAALVFLGPDPVGLRPAPSPSTAPSAAVTASPSIVSSPSVGPSPSDASSPSVAPSPSASGSGDVGRSGSPVSGSGSPAASPSAS